MEKFYTLFCATDELHTSPAIQMYSRLHDVSVSVGGEQIVSFLLPSYTHSFRHDELTILFDEDMIDVLTATVHEHTQGLRIFTNVTLRIQARDIGSTSIGFTTPEAAEPYSLKKVEPQFITNNPMS